MSGKEWVKLALSQRAHDRLVALSERRGLSPSETVDVLVRENKKSANRQRFNLGLYESWLSIVLSVTQRVARKQAARARQRRAE
ncbi:hypothetical protein BH10PSE14_BH10PSE14_04080 [soil metagenome]